MLSRTLQALIDEGRTSAREVGELTGKAPSTVYRWIAGKSEPDFNSIRLLVRHLPDRKAQQSILSVFTAGTNWQVVHSEMELDVNSDGTITADDALDAAIRSTKSSGTSLLHIREACKIGNVNSDDVVTVTAVLDEVISHCHVARRVLIEVCEKSNRRKKLKLVK